MGILTCKELEAAPINSPKDWATKAVAVAKAEKSRKRLVSAGWPVIQYTMLQYTNGHITWGAGTQLGRDLKPGTCGLDPPLHPEMSSLLLFMLLPELTHISFPVI